MEENNTTNEKETTTENTSAAAAATTPTGNTSKGLSTLERADAIAERTEKAAERIEAANAKAEELEMERRLGGQTRAGQSAPEPVKPKVESDKEYADRISSGDLKESEGVPLTE